jgi:regulator of Ty1 transposition protein 103
VVEVWRQRQIFEEPIQQAAESRIDDIDKQRGSGKRLMGGSLLGGASGGVPNELKPLVPLQTDLSKVASNVSIRVGTANQEWNKHTNPDTPKATPPVQAARLNGIIKSLANAENAVAESIKARRALVDGLQKMLEAHQKTLSEEEAQLKKLNGRKVEIETTKTEVEDAIMRGLSEAEDHNGNGVEHSEASTQNPHRSPFDSFQSPTQLQSANVDEDEIKPPSVEAFTPEGSPEPEEPIPRNDQYQQAPQFNPPVAGADLMSSLAIPFARPTSDATIKKRKLNDDDFGGFEGIEGLVNDDVADS